MGVKNPYRYRGYRYDSETGLYYLQSRYYNPEWGRFINADAIIGQTGELLGHNMFAYCKNNPINLKDPSGFRHLRFDGEEVTYSGQSRIHEITDNAIAWMGTIGGQGAVSKADSIAEGYISSKVASRSRGLVTKNIYLNNGNIPTQIQVGAQRGLTLKALGKVGVASIGTIGLSVWDNSVHYQTSDAIWRTALDIGSLATSVALGIGIAAGASALATAGIVAIPAAVVGVATFGVGYAIGEGANALKDKYFGRRK